MKALCSRPWTKQGPARRGPALPLPMEPPDPRGPRAVAGSVGQQSPSREAGRGVGVVRQGAAAASGGPDFCRFPAPKMLGSFARGISPQQHLGDWDLWSSGAKLSWMNGGILRPSLNLLFFTCRSVMMTAACLIAAGLPVHASAQ